MSEAKVDEAPPCPNHYMHKYKFEELALAESKGSNEQPYFRASVFFHKKPGLTDQFFHDHWKSVHADLAIQTKNAGLHLLRYTQFHMEPKNREEIQPLIDASKGTMQLVPWDACAEFLAKDAQSFINFMNEIYNSNHLMSCGQRFVDLHKGYHIMCGYENVIYGAGIPGIGGTDGILPGDYRLTYGEGVAPTSVPSSVPTTAPTTVTPTVPNSQGNGACCAHDSQDNARPLRNSKSFFGVGGKRMSVTEHETASQDGSGPLRRKKSIFDKLGLGGLRLH